MPATTYKRLTEQMFFERRWGDANAAKNADHKTNKAEEEERKAVAAAKGLVAIGGPYYAKAEGEPATHKSVGSKIVPLTPDEKKQQQKSTLPNTKKTSAGSPAKKISTRAPKDKVDVPTGAEAIPVDVFTDGLVDLKKKTLDRLDNSTTLSSMRASFIPDINKFFGRLNDIAKLRKGNERRKELEMLVNNFGVMQGNNKLYANHFTKTGGLYKVFGDKDTTKVAQFFKNMLAEEGLDLPSASDSKSHAKQYLAGQSKPNFGHVFRNTDPTVKGIFGSDPILNDLSPRFHSLYGPSDKTGALMRSGGANAASFFKHSVESNVGVDRVMTALGDLAQASGQTPRDTIGYAGVANALGIYRKNMKLMLKDFGGLPPKARRERVGQIYAQLAHDMFTADKEIASSIMKNMAELALYDTEIAGGDEAYLPADGSFPSGDKIVITRKGTKVEKITSISVKWGKNSDGTFGMPGEASKILLYHPNPNYRDLLDNRAGRAGYEVGVRSDIIHESNMFDRMARESGINKCFDKATLNSIREMGVEMTNITKSFKKRHPNNKKGELIGADLGGIRNDPDMKKAWTKLHALLKQGDQKKLIDLLGKNNYSRIMKSNEQVMNLYSIMSFGAGLNTANGFEILLHNKQYYDHKAGKFVSETHEGTPRIRDWGISAIHYGDRAGGTKAGFIGAGK